MGRLRNIAKKALAAAVLYAGKRVAARVAGKVVQGLAKKNTGG